MGKGDKRTRRGKIFAGSERRVRTKTLEHAIGHSFKDLDELEAGRFEQFTGFTKSIKFVLRVKDLVSEDDVVKA